MICPYCSEPDCEAPDCAFLADLEQMQAHEHDKAVDELRGK